MRGFSFCHRLGVTYGDDWPRGESSLLVLITLGPSPSLLTLGLTFLAERSTLLSPPRGHCSHAPDTGPAEVYAPLAWQEGKPALALSVQMPTAGGW